MRNKFILDVNKMIVFCAIISQSIAFSASQDSMNLDSSTSSSSSSQGNSSSIPEKFIKIMEAGLEYSISSRNPNTLVTCFAAQYGNNPQTLVSALSTLTTCFSQIAPERIKNIMMLLTNYVVMGTDELDKAYDEASEKGVGLKILDRMTALVRKQKTLAVSGRFEFTDGSIFHYEALLKTAATNRKKIKGKNSEKPVSLGEVEY